MPKIDEMSMTNQLDQRELEKRGELAEQLIYSLLKEEDPSRVVQLGVLLSDEERSWFVEFL